MTAGINYADPLRPFNNTFWCKPLPAGRALHPKTTAVTAELVRQSQITQPIVNGSQATPVWTAEPTIVPVDQPLVAVTCHHDSTMQAIGAGGMPIPAALTPTPDSDSAVIIYQPDATNPVGGSGYYWELQGYNPATLTCNSLARKSNVNQTPHGTFIQWITSGYEYKTPGATYSTYELPTWGIQGSGLPYAPGLLTVRDIDRGYVDHVLLLEVYDAAAGAHVWPAARSDGAAGSTNPASALSEGMWIDLEPDYAIPTMLDPITQLYVQGARDFGLIITDRTLSCLAVRCAPSAQSLITDAHLTGFPWADVRCLAVGSDLLWHPVA